MMSNIDLIVDIFKDLENKLIELFDIGRKESFHLTSSILLTPKYYNISALSNEDNCEIERLFNKFKSIDYSINDMRRAYRESYLLSLQDEENYEINSTLELPLLYLKEIVDILSTKFDVYSESKILNAYGNDGNLATILSSNGFKVYETVKDENELKISEKLRDFCKQDFLIQTDLPSSSFRADIIVGDPFLRKIEDILIYFLDYQEYLNYGGFFVSVLPTNFVRDRVFSDMIEEYSLVLIGVVEYPIDLVGGLMKSSIVILEKKSSLNKDFFHTNMPSVKNINDNLKVIEDIKNYLKEYIGGNYNENNVN